MKKWRILILFGIMALIGGIIMLSYCNTYLFSRHINQLIEKNDMISLSEYLEKNGDVNSKPFVFDFDRTNYPPLTFAAYKGNAEAVQILIDHGADVNNTNATNGTSPILASLQKALLYNPNRISIAGILALHGADINYRDRNGQGENAVTSVLSPSTSEDNLVEKTEQLSFITYLIEHEADYTISCTYGNMLSKAAACDNQLVIEYLIEELNMDANITDSNNNTPLMYAIINGSVNAVECLLGFNADQTLANYEGKTAWDFAVEIGNSTILSMLDEPSE